MWLMQQKYSLGNILTSVFPHFMFDVDPRDTEDPNVHLI